MSGKASGFENFDPAPIDRQLPDGDLSTSGRVESSNAAVLNLWSADHWWSAAMGLVVREQSLMFFLYSH